MNPLLPCGHRTIHNQSIGCCSVCKLLFSSDTAFEKHRRDGACLTPAEARLVPRPSRTAPGEVIYGWPSPDRRPAAWSKGPQDARGALREGSISVDHPEVAHPGIGVVTGPQNRQAAAREARPLPLHRTEAGYPYCSTCDGGGCPDCTDPA